ncbi:hypothetical protein [Kitasatospora sp. KL5]|uniref:hypothetical protein n=1 Tax=Kitasatospora sp. KL5 TaxID=3425125 RepID=UPI003D6EF13E
MPAHRRLVDPSAGPEVVAFVAKLGELVASTGMSVADLAYEAVVPRSSLYAVLGGRRIPSRKFMELLLWQVEKRSCWAEAQLKPALEEVGVLHDRLRSALPERRPAARYVHVGVLPEQVAVAEAFSAYLDGLVDRGVDVDQLSWVSPAWLRRYASGTSIPSWDAISELDEDLKETFNVDDWDTHLSALADLARRARSARAEKRRWARVLAGGDP